MSRHIVSFPTMVTLMGLDRMSNIAMVSEFDYEHAFVI